MTLDEYINSTDSNDFWRLSCGDFWRLSCGEHRNLLDEAIERIEFLKNKSMNVDRQFATSTEIVSKAKNEIINELENYYNVKIDEFIKIKILVIIAQLFAKNTESAVK